MEKSLQIICTNSIACCHQREGAWSPPWRRLSWRSSDLLSYVHTDRRVKPPSMHCTIYTSQIHWKITWFGVCRHFELLYSIKGMTTSDGTYNCFVILYIILVSVQLTAKKPHLCPKHTPEFPLCRRFTCMVATVLNMINYIECVCAIMQIGDFCILNI